MRALRIAEPGRIGIADVPAPVAGPGETLCRPLLIGLCGTDLELLDGQIAPDQVRYPLIPGHEWVGAGPDGLVVAEGLIGCTTCARCLAGEPNLCAAATETGFTRDGAAAELIAVPTRALHAVGPEIGVDNAVLLEPAAVVWRALDRAQPAPGSRILIIGDGTIGLLAARLSAAWSPAEVHVRGLRASQLALVRRSGASRFFREPTAGEYDLVIDAAGSRRATLEALAAARTGGTVLLLAYLGRGVEVPLPVDEIINRDLSVRGSFASTPAAWNAVLSGLSRGTLDLDWLITHRFALGEFDAALHALREPGGCRGKVILDLSL
ncbi:zinc-dependent alcohol dehydrogenase [Mycetocola spongiae]|uniref:zinc-dependent alcohol dehydrogenase n=1 Tax=Mycetocola spongiae TaxID=2859226 RepID=UPI001CF24F4A|nr:alcohol dehydrogenase catalytic domain-containing protein [Mycetocola spongiae]UCR89646.1 alcohol dehydrogenase catalytic domain-containing protein [Mycetocola spongiae]